MTAATADTLYRWLDEDGRPQFSDRPPPRGVAGVERIEVPSYAAPERPVEQAPYSILNQLKRLEDSRERLAGEYQAREERRQRERELSLRQRELEARERQPATLGPPVYVYPRRPFRAPSGYPPAWPAQPALPPTLWPPDHPAYRPRPPSARIPYGLAPGP